MAEFTATVDDTADVTDLASGEVDFLRAVDETAVVADAVSRNLDYARVNDDAVASTDALAPVSESARSFSDAVSLSDDVDVKALIVEDGVTVSDAIASALIALNVVIADGVAMSDALAIEGVAFTATISDAVVVTDSATSGFVKVVTRSDSVVLTDQARRTATLGRVLGDSVSVVDAIASDATIVFSIAEAHALSESRVRITFSVPALNDDALSDPTNYVFDNVSTGTVDVSPFSVFIPPGQPQPSYVEIETSEHTDGGTYQVALKSVIRGGSGEFADETPYAYTGIGVAPEIAVVIATSPTLVEVHFTEAIADNHDARSKYNYTWTGGLQTVAVLSVIGEVVTLQTTAQVPGTLYTLNVTATEPLAADVVISDSLDLVDALAFKLEPIRVEIDDAAIVVVDAITVDLARHLVLVVGTYTAPVSQNAGVQSSLDAVTWSDEAAFPQEAFTYPYRAAVGNGLNIVTANNNVYRSAGYGAWATSVLSTVQAACFSPDLGLFVVGGANQFYVSEDAENWTAYPADVPSGTLYFKTLAWSPSLGLFVGADSGDYIQTSPDGMVWTRHASASVSVQFWGSAWNAGAGLFCIVGLGGASGFRIQTSPDGATWTQRTPGGGFTGYWNSVAASATRFVAVGYDGVNPAVQTSDDGITWTPQTFAGGYTNQPLGVAYRPELGLFVMCGAGAEIQTSPDGVTWTQRTVGGGFTDGNLRGAA